MFGSKRSKTEPTGRLASALGSRVASRFSDTPKSLNTSKSSTVPKPNSLTLIITDNKIELQDKFGNQVGPLVNGRNANARDLTLISKLDILFKGYPYIEVVNQCSSLESIKSAVGEVKKYYGLSRQRVVMQKKSSPSIDSQLSRTDSYSDASSVSIRSESPPPPASWSERFVSKGVRRLKQQKFEPSSKDLTESPISLEKLQENFAALQKEFQKFSQDISAFQAAATTPSPSKTEDRASPRSDYTNLVRSGEKSEPIKIGLTKIFSGHRNTSEGAITI